MCVWYLSVARSLFVPCRSLCPCLRLYLIVPCSFLVASSSILVLNSFKRYGDRCGELSVTYYICKTSLSGLLDKSIN